MRHFALRRCARLVLYATIARLSLACGADTDHGPPIGSPTGPIGPVVSEGGASSSARGGVDAGGASTGTSPGINGGAFGAGSGGMDTFGVAGNASGGGDPFGVGGSSTGSNPFGIGGSPSAFSGGSPF